MSVLYRTGACTLLWPRCLGTWLVIVRGIWWKIADVIGLRVLPKCSGAPSTLTLRFTHIAGILCMANRTMVSIVVPV